MNNSPPPAYGLQRPINSLTRVQPRSLRVAVLSFTLAGTIWAAVWGVRDLRYISSDGETSLMKVFDVITGIIYLVVAFIELWGFVAALMNNARLVRIYAFASVLSIVFAAVGGILEIVAHFVLKKVNQAKCIVDWTGDVTTSTGWFGTVETTFTEADAATYCQKLFSRNTWYYIIWLFAAVFFASMASLFSFAFSRQLSNPSAFPSAGGGGLRPTPSHEQGVPLQAYQSRLNEDYVPPYPGPPPNAPSGAYDSDLKPNSDSSFQPVSAEDRAWQASLDESERREWEQHEASQTEDASRARGVVGGNEAEDDAWQEARRTAGTAGGATNNPFADHGARRGGRDEEEGGRV